jgi:hypothetical protein
MELDTLIQMNLGLEMERMMEYMDVTDVAGHLNIKTQAGKDMFKYFNDNYGSSIWGRVLEGIKAIEKELE